MKKEQDSFFRFVLISLGFHGIILIALTLKLALFPSKAPDYKQAVRVDVVALPEKQIEPPKPKPVAQKPDPVKKPTPPKPKPKPKKPKPLVKKPKPKPEKPKPVVKEKKKPKPEEVQEEQDSAIARLKALQKLKEKEKVEEGPAQKLEYKGNALSKGNSLTGLEKLKHDDYIDQLLPHIKAHWTLPEWLASDNLRAIVLLRIDRSGGIKSQVFLTRSGNETFDEYVSGTLEKSVPFPPPPANLVRFYETEGIKVGFPE